MAYKIVAYPGQGTKDGISNEMDARVAAIASLGHQPGSYVNVLVEADGEAESPLFRGKNPWKLVDTCCRFPGGAVVWIESATPEQAEEWARLTQAQEENAVRANSDALRELQHQHFYNGT